MISTPIYLFSHYFLRSLPNVNAWGPEPFRAECCIRLRTAFGIRGFPPSCMYRYALVKRFVFDHSIGTKRAECGSMIILARQRVPKH